MTYTTLNTITEDLLKIVRGSKVSESETISKRQIEDWVHQYRAVLLKQSIDKNHYPNPDFIQELAFLELEQVRVEGTGTGASLTFPYTFDFPLQSGERLEGDQYLLRTRLDLPKTVNFNHKSGFTWIGTVDGTEFQYIPQYRHIWQKYKKYANSETLVFLKDNKLYFTNDDPDIDYITIRGIFENPMEVGRFVNPNTDLPYSDIDTPYPIPNHMLDPLKKMILKTELGIIAESPSDSKNDSEQGVSENVENQFRV